MLEIFLALKRKLNVVIEFVMDKALQSVLLGESVDHALAMLSSPSRQVTGDAYIENALALVRHYVDIAAFQSGLRAGGCALNCA